MASEDDGGSCQFWDPQIRGKLTGEYFYAESDSKSGPVCRTDRYFNHEASMGKVATAGDRTENFWESIGGTMRSKTLASLGILLGLAVSAAFAQVDREADSRPTGIMAPLAPDGGNAADGPEKSVSSANWAGYAVTGSSFTSALGSWVVPAYHCLTTPNSKSVFFVGIDGYSDKTSESIGTESDCVGTKYQYFAWYVLGTTETKITGFSVKSGDVISASVSYAGSEFTVEIYNITQGLFFSKSAAVSGAQRSSAEWIVQRLGVTQYYPLMDFGKVSSGSDYTNIVDTDWASDSSVSGPISDFGSNMVKINMVNSANVTLATPSALTTDGSSFTVTWKHE
jgi:hypothetical protein